MIRTKKLSMKNRLLLICSSCIIVATIIVLSNPSGKESNTTVEFQRPNVLVSLADVPVMEQVLPQIAGNMSEYIQIQADEMQLRTAYGNEAVFPELFRIAQGNMLLGYSEDEAMEAAKTYLISREAMYQYVVELGFGVTDEEVSLHIEDVINELKQTSNYDEVLAYYQNEEVIFEDTIRSNYEYYRETLAIKNYIDANMPKSVETIVDPETGEAVDNSLHELVSTLEQQSMKKYTSTPHFRQFSKALDDMKTFIFEKKDNLVIDALQNKNLSDITYEAPLPEKIAVKDDLKLTEEDLTATEKDPMIEKDIEGIRNEAGITEDVTN